LTSAATRSAHAASASPYRAIASGPLRVGGSARRLMPFVRAVPARATDAVLTSLRARGCRRLRRPRRGGTGWRSPGPRGNAPPQEALRARHWSSTVERATKWSSLRAPVRAPVVVSGHDSAVARLGPGTPVCRQGGHILRLEQSS
jgi:hypothetical protein